MRDVCSAWVCILRHWYFQILYCAAATWEKSALSERLQTAWRNMILTVTSYNEKYIAHMVMEIKFVQTRHWHSDVLHFLMDKHISDILDLKGLQMSDRGWETWLKLQKSRTFPRMRWIRRRSHSVISLPFSLCLCLPTERYRESVRLSEKLCWSSRPCVALGGEGERQREGESKVWAKLSLALTVRDNTSQQQLS